MKVKELIEILEKIEDKTLTVSADTQDGAGYDVHKVEVLKDCIYFS